VHPAVALLLKELKEKQGKHALPVCLEPAMPQRRAHNYVDAEENQDDFPPRYTYVVNLLHQKRKAYENYYYPQYYAS